MSAAVAGGERDERQNTEREPDTRSPMIGGRRNEATSGINFHAHFGARPFRHLRSWMTAQIFGASIHYAMRQNGAKTISRFELFGGGARWSRGRQYCLPARDNLDNLADQSVSGGSRCGCLPVSSLIPA